MKHYIIIKRDDNSHMGAYTDNITESAQILFSRPITVPELKVGDDLGFIYDTNKNIVGYVIRTDQKELNHESGNYRGR